MMRGLSRASPSTGHFPTGFRRVAFGADRPCCDRLDAGVAHQPSSRTHVAPRTMVRRGAGSPKSSFSEIRTLAAGAAGAEIERRVRKTAVLCGGGTTGSNPSSSSGESGANLSRAEIRLFRSRSHDPAPRRALPGMQQFEAHGGLGKEGKQRTGKRDVSLRNVLGRTSARRRGRGRVWLKGSELRQLG
jgi:hypothetical protein